jgi:hypothetical protein
VQRKINSVNDEIKKISTISREEFFNGYELNFAADISDLSTMDEDELKKVNRQLITRIKKTGGIFEELNNRRLFYNNDISGQKYETVYSALNKIQFMDYEKAAGVKEYKARLNGLSEKFKEIVGVLK